MSEQYIKTENITLSASIKSLHFNVGVKMISPTQAVFLLPKTPLVEQHVSNFWDGKLPVDPIAFTNAKFDLLRAINRLKEEQR